MRVQSGYAVILNFGSDYMQMKPGEMSDMNVSTPKKKYQ
jgi:hypothetical protein